MNLAELKEEVRDTWEDLQGTYADVVLPETFLPEIRKYGDLRKKATWEKAFVYLYTAFFHRCAGIEAYWYVTDFFNFTPDKRFYEYRHELFEAFLQYPDGLDIIKLGLEQLYRHTATQTENIDGFYRLVQEQRERANGLPARSAGQLPASAGISSSPSRGCP